MGVESGAAVPADGGTAPVVRTDGRVLASAVGDDPAGVLQFAADLASSRGHALFVLLPVTVPHPTPLTSPDTGEAGERLEDVVERAGIEGEGQPAVRCLVRVGRNREKVVRHAVENHDIRTLVVESSGSSHTLDALLRGGSVPSDADVVAATRPGNHRDVASILVPVAGGPHSGLAVDVARAVAEQRGAWVDLLHVAEPSDEARARGERALDAAVDRLGGFETADTWLLEADDVTGTIVEQSQYYGLTVIGAPRKGRLREFVFGSTAAGVRDGAEGTVLTVRSGAGEQSWLDRLTPA